MKRTIYIAAGMLVLGLAIVGATRTTAQAPAVASPAAKTKVAMFNITYVMKHYEKFKTFEAELKTTIAGYQATDAKLRSTQEEEAKKVGPTTTPEMREQVQAKIKDLERQIEDNKMVAGKVMGKKQEEQLKILYLDVRTHVARYAASNSFDVILHYNDAITNEDYNSAPNIARKLQAGALMPIYMANGMDVSVDIVRSLNAAYPKR